MIFFFLVSQVKLCDFGLATAKNRSKTFTGASSPHSAALTAQWTAPEVFDGLPKSFASDVYAMAVTMWEIMERRVPFEGLAPDVVSDMARRGVRPSLSPETERSAMAPLLKRCWDPRGDLRPRADAVDLTVAGELIAMASAVKTSAGDSLLGGLGERMRERDARLKRTLEGREKEARDKTKKRQSVYEGGIED